MEKVKSFKTKLAVYKTHPLLIVLAPLEYDFPFKANITNMVHADDNLASSRHKRSTAARSSSPMAELD